MTSTIRRRLIAGFVAVTAFVLIVAGRGWLFDTASAAAEVEDLRQLLRDEEERAMVLAGATDAARARSEAKNAVIADLIAGAIDLPHAADLFCELNVAYPNYFEMMRVCYPGLPDAELVCRNVIEYCSAVLERRSERTAVLARLEDEFAAFQQRARR